MYKPIIGTLNHKLGKSDLSQDYGSDSDEVTSLDEANVLHSLVDITNESGDVLHAPVLDLDVPAFLVPSSTPGHSHLVIDVPMTWDDYDQLLNILADVGIIEEGYYRASDRRGYSSIRLPWVKKESPKAEKETQSETEKEVPSNDTLEDLF